MPLPAAYRPTASSLDDLTVALDGWAAGATDSAGTQWTISKFEGWWEAPNPRLALVDRPQDHGAFDGPSYLSPRVLTLEGLAISLDRASHLLARDIIASLCWDMPQLATLVVTEPDRPTRRCMVRPSGAAKARDVTDTVCAWSLVLTAPDPRRYDDVESLLTLYPPTGASGGVTFPLTFPISLSTTGVSTSSGVATNAGTIATRPVVAMYGPLVDPQIAHVDEGKSLSLSISLASDDVLVLDFDRRTVLLNGSASRSSTLTSTAAWWELAPGGNDVAFTAGGGDGRAEMRWRSAWL